MYNFAKLYSINKKTCLDQGKSLVGTSKILQRGFDPDPLVASAVSKA